MVILNTAGAEGKSARRALLKGLFENRTTGLIFIIIAFNLVLAIIRSSSFFTLENYQGIFMNMSIESFIVIGMTILLISANLDLSMGANMALTGIIAGFLLKYEHFGGASAIALAIVASLTVGAVNGYFVAFVGVNPVITTLATGFVCNGIAVWIAGPGYTDFPNFFKSFGEGKFLGVQGPVWFMVAFTAIFHFLMSNARSFRRLYFVGASKRSATMSGINTPMTIFAAFVAAAVLASLAGIVSASRFDSAMTSIGTGVELRAITAAVIGGVSFSGGTGTVLGAVLGSIFLSFINNGLILLGIDPSWQNVVVGVVLILSIIVDVGRSARK